MKWHIQDENNEYRALCGSKGADLTVAANAWHGRIASAKCAKCDKLHRAAANAHPHDDSTPHHNLKVRS